MKKQEQRTAMVGKIRRLGIKKRHGAKPLDKTKIDISRRVSHYVVDDKGSTFVRTEEKRFGQCCSCEYQRYNLRLTNRFGRVDEKNGRFQDSDVLLMRSDVEYQFGRR